MSSGQRDYYAVLGVGREASGPAIKRAYHAAARRYHPDKNLMPGETELFLEIQHAYEVLADPRRRALYDASLPHEEPSTPPIACFIQYSRSSIGRLEESQLVYTLLEVAPPEKETIDAAAPVDLCLVLDRSTSMHGPKLELAKQAAIRIVDMLRPQDAFSLIIFSDRADVLLPLGRLSESRQAQSRIRAIQPTGATEILRGLEAGLSQLRRSIGQKRGQHLMLLTDGHTYGDETACLQLAEEAAGDGITISGFGVGTDWNDAFLDALTARTGGNSIYISPPHEIERLLVEKFRALTHHMIDDLVLETQPQDGVRLTYAFRMQPESGPVEIRSELHLGPVRDQVALRVLFEFTIEPRASRQEQATLLEGALQAWINGQGGSIPPMRIRMWRPVNGAASEEPPSQSMMVALSRLALYRLQERARQEAEGGEYEAATRHLRNLAGRLEAEGFHELSETALLEAQNLERSRAFSQGGGKEIKYGTRGLLLPQPDTSA